MKQSPSKIRVVADDRERAGGVIGVLRELAGVEVEVRRLEVGDFLVEDRFVVERKTLSDFAISLVDGRLFRQAGELSGGASKGLLIIEGTAQDLAELGVTRESMQGALLTISVFYGLPVLRSLDAAETARLIQYLGRQSQRVASGSVRRGGYRPRGRRHRQLFILQSLPGVGPERAARLLARFSTVQAVANATAEQLAEVNGIGEATAERIRAILN